MTLLSFRMGSNPLVGMGTSTWSISANKTDALTYQLPIQLVEAAPAGGTTVTLAPSPTPHTSTKGVGQDYILSALSCEIVEGATTPTIPVNLTVVNNPLYLPDKLVTILLSNDDSIDFVKSVLQVNIIDDARPNLIDITNPGHGLEACAYDGVTDDTDNLQAIIDYLKDNSGGVVLFPSDGSCKIVKDDGTGIKLPATPQISYVGNSSDRSAKILVTGYDVFNHALKNRDGGVGYTWGDDLDSPEMVFHNITIDGNCYNNQAPLWRDGGKEQCFVLYIGADPGVDKVQYAGRQIVIMDNCTTKNSVSDGVTASSNCDLRMYNCTTDRCKRGGVVALGGYVLIDMQDVDCINSPPEDEIEWTAMGLQTENADSDNGYGDTYRQDWTINNVRCDPEFDFSFQQGPVSMEGSILSITGLTQEDDAKGGWYTRLRNGSATFTGCLFVSRDDLHVNVGENVEFDTCTFRMRLKDDGVSIPDGAFQYSWQADPPTITGERLTLTDCAFTGTAGVAAHAGDVTAIAIDSGDSLANDNLLSISGGSLSAAYSTLIGTQNNQSPCKISIDGMDLSAVIKTNGWLIRGGDCTVNYMSATLANLSVDKMGFIYLHNFDSNSVLNLTNVTVTQAANQLECYYGNYNNITVVGHRTILAPDNTPPTVNTHGLIGDIYRLQNLTEYVCTTSAYKSVGGEQAGVWELVT